MQIRVRLMPNGHFAIEGRPWYFPIWAGLRAMSWNTRGSITAGKENYVLSREEINSAHYPLCWHDCRGDAEVELRLIAALLGYSQEEYDSKLHHLIDKALPQTNLK